MLFEISCDIILVIIDVYVYIIFPFIQLLVATIMKEEIECKNSFIAISDWLIVDSVFTFLTGVNVYYYIKSNKGSFCDIITSFCYYILAFFNILWLLLGTIDIFNNCIVYEKDDIKFYLILSLCTFIILIYKLLIVKKPKRKPLLDII